MKNQPQHKLATISFATILPDAVDLWPTILSSDSRQANQIGRQRADEILQYAANNQAPMILGHDVAAIIGKGVYGPAETGFFHRVAAHCIESSAEHGETRAVRPSTRPVLHLVM